MRHETSKRSRNKQPKERVKILFPGKMTLKKGNINSYLKYPSYQFPMSTLMQGSASSHATHPTLQYNETTHLPVNEQLQTIQSQTRLKAISEEPRNPLQIIPLSEM